MKPVLYVLQESPFLIKLKKGENVSDTLWEFTLVWWTNKKNTSNDEIEIPINEFISKKNWLRTNWIREGGNVIIDHEARSTIKNALNQFENFKEFINNNIYDDQNFDDSKLKRTLTSFQKRDINRLLKLPNGANFSVPGAGKTTSTLVIWDFLRQKNTIDKLLVVCPKSAFEAWNEEPKDVFKSILTISVFENKPIEIDTDIIICNYEKLESQINRQHLINWMTSKKVMLVLDEAHRVKGGTKSVRWFGCRELSHHASRVELLSGTPMPQGYQDLRNLFSLSWPNVPQTYFTDELFKSLKRGSLFVRTKNELGLNPPIIVSHDIEMGKIQKDVYTALCRSYRGAFTLTDHDDRILVQKVGQL